MAALDSRSKKLDRLESLDSLLSNAKFRGKVQAIIDEFVAQGDDAPEGGGGQLDTSKILDPRLDDLMKRLEPLRDAAEQIQIDRILEQRDSMRDRFIKDYPEIITEKVFEQIQTEQAKKHGLALNFEHLENAVYVHIATKGMKVASQRGAESAIAAAAKKGGRVVVVKAGQAKNGNQKETKVTGPISRKDLVAALAASL